MLSQCNKVVKIFLKESAYPFNVSKIIIMFTLATYYDKEETSKAYFDLVFHINETSSNLVSFEGRKSNKSFYTDDKSDLHDDFLHQFLTKTYKKNLIY